MGTLKKNGWVFHWVIKNNEVYGIMKNSHGDTREEGFYRVSKPQLAFEIALYNRL